MIIPKRERILLPPERKRDKQLKIWVSQEELNMIHQKMADFGTRHMGAFIRKLVIDGYVIKPKMFGNTLGVPAVITLVSTIVFGKNCRVKSASSSWAGITGSLLHISIPQTTVREYVLGYYTMVSILPIMPSSRTLSVSW